MGGSRTYLAIAIALAIGLVAMSLYGAWLLTFDDRVAASGPAPLPPGKVQHVFVIVQENHAYDNYFGAYCPTAGPYCSTAANGIPSGVCLPNSLAAPAAGCSSAFAMPAYARPPHDLPHNWSSAVSSWDAGRMDGFVQANGGNPAPMGYYTASSVSAYWDLASQYGLGDAFFSGALSGSVANHWLLIAGSTPPAATNGTLPEYVENHTLTPFGKQYLSQANNTTTLADQLTQVGASWRVYDSPVVVGGYGAALARAAVSNNTSVNTAFADFDPFLARAATYSAPKASHFVDRYRIATDLKTGNVANVSWVFPSVPQSEHPIAQLYFGESWVISTINAIESSPGWNSSVIFLTWDDYGGWYDHVAPPNENGTAPGPRVPLIVIGPYVRENFVNAQFATDTSIVQFLQRQFGIPLSGPQIGDVSGYFDFSHSPRPPLQFSVNESYPVPLQAPALAVPLGASVAPVETAVGVVLRGPNAYVLPLGITELATYAPRVSW